MKDVYLSSIRLINVGPWGDETISFTDGINVIVGPNGAGKTALFNCVRVALKGKNLTKDDRLDVIHKGCDSASIYFLFSDSSCYNVFINKSDCIYYYCEDLNASSNFIVQDGLPNDLVEKLGSLVQGDLICNMINMEQEKFLVDTNSSDNYGVISFLINNENLDRLVENLENYRIPCMKKLNKDLTSKKQVYENLLNEFKYTNLSELKNKAKESDDILSNLEGLLNANEILESVTEFTLVPKEVEESIESIELLDESLGLMNNLIDFKSVDDNLTSIINDCKFVDSIVSNFNSLIELKDVSKAKKLFNEVSSLDSALGAVIEVLSKGDIQTNIDYFKEQLNEEVGETYDSCPIYGKIKFSHGECIPCD